MPLMMKVKISFVICALVAVAIVSTNAWVQAGVIVALVVLPFWMLGWLEARRNEDMERDHDALRRIGAAYAIPVRADQLEQVVNDLRAMGSGLANCHDCGEPADHAGKPMAVVNHMSMELCHLLCARCSPDDLYTQH